MQSECHWYQGIRLICVWLVLWGCATPTTALNLGWTGVFGPSWGGNTRMMWSQLLMLPLPCFLRPCEYFLVSCPGFLLWTMALVVQGRKAMASSSSIHFLACLEISASLSAWPLALAGAPHCISTVEEAPGPSYVLSAQSTIVLAGYCLVIVQIWATCHQRN